MDVMNKRRGGEDNVGHGRLKAVEIFAGGGGHAAWHGARGLCP